MVVVLVVAAFVVLVVPVKTHADPDLAYPALHWKGHAVAVVTGLAGPVKYALGMEVQLAAVTHPAAQSHQLVYCCCNNRLRPLPFATFSCTNEQPVPYAQMQQ